MNETKQATILLSKIHELASAFPRQVISIETIAVYGKHLGMMDTSVICDAIDHLIGTATFFPTIGEIKAVAAESGMVDGEWEVAWAELITVIQDYGVDRKTKTYWTRNGPTEGPVFPGWSSPLVAEAVALVGYRAVCMAEEKDQTTIRAQFRDAYNKARKRKVVAVQTGVVALPGADVPAVAAVAS